MSTEIVLAWESNDRGERTQFDDTWINFTGWCPSTSLAWTSKIHPEDLPRVLEEHAIKSKECKPFRISYRLANKAGEYFHVDDVGSPRWDNDRFTGFVGQCFVSGRSSIDGKNAELLDLTLQYSTSLIAYINRDFVFEYANQKYADHWSKQRSEIIGVPLVEIIGKAKFEEAFQRFERVLGGESMEFELTVDRNETKLVMNLQYVPCILKDGTVDGFFVLGDDLTRLRQMEKRFALAIQGSQVGVWEVDSNRPEWMFTEHIERLLDYDPGELKNSRTLARGLIHPDDRDALDQVREQHLINKKLYVIEFRARTKSGDYRWLRSCGEAERIGGKVVRVAGTVANIDEIKKAELQAEAEVERRDEFLAMLSHELRNPLTAILHSVFFGNESEQVPETLRTVWDIIDRQTNHMGTLLDELLDVSRITRKKIVFNKVAVDLSKVVLSVVETLRPSASNKQQQLTLVGADKPHIIVGDSNRLEQALANLLENAIKYTPNSGAVSVAVEEIGDSVTVSVRDNGKGIGADDLDQIFNLFYQEKQPLSRAGGGLGVGLFLVHQILEEHGGSVSVESPGQGLGSEFVIKIPLTDRKPVESEAIKEYRFDGTKLVLIEDHSDSRMTLNRALTKVGFDVDVFADGESALEAVSGLNPAVAVIDIGLPGKDGYQLAREIRQMPHGKEMLLIALTGYGLPSDIAAAIDAGFDNHFTKPLCVKRLCALIGSQLESSARETSS